MPPPAVLALTLRYITAHAVVESWEHGYAACRCEPCAADPREMGCASLTDGVHVWPEGLAHYATAHSIAPPAALITAALHAGAAAALARGRAAPSILTDPGLLIGDDASVHAWGSPGELLVARNHLMWDSESKSAVPIPPGTCAWLRAHSTLTLKE